MEVLFVIDNLQDIERKVSIVEGLCDNIKFFVKSALVPGIMKNKHIVERVVAIYNNNVNVTIDKYIRKEDYIPQNTLLYYSSAEINASIVETVRSQIGQAPDVVYIKKKLGWWSKFKRWVYQKFIKLIFGINDEFASIKLQFFSAEMMYACVQTSFKNHIFTAPNALVIELGEEEGKTYYNKPKFNKNYLYNPIVMCVIGICYVVFEKMFKLPFWTYFLFISLLLSTIVSWLVMVVKNTFDTRYKK